MSRVQILLAVLACVILGCSSSTSKDPTQPVTSDESVIIGSAIENPGNRYSLGFWNVRIGVNDGNVEIIPARYVECHLNVVKFLETDACDNCVTIGNVQMISANELIADINITHPYAPTKYYCAFDMRGICMLPANYSFNPDGRSFAYGNDAVHLMNADGYTALYNPTEFPVNEEIPILGYIPGDLAHGGDLSATLNPFLAYARNWDRRLFGVVQADISRTMHMFIPDGTDEIEFGYAIDVSWMYMDYVEIPWYDYPPEANCLEAYEVVITMEEEMYPGYGQQAEIIVDVYDHQGLETIGSVTAQAPDLFNGSIVLNYSDDQPDDDAHRFVGIITNELVPDVGDYPVLVKVTDTTSDENLGDIFAWNIHTIHVDTCWAQTWGGSGVDSGMAVVTDDENYVYVVGRCSGTVDFNPGPDEDIYTVVNGSYISKFNPAGGYEGTRVWGQDFGSFVSANDVALDDNGCIYVTGRFSGTVDFNAGQGLDNHFGVSDVFLTKCTTDGVYLWTRTWGAEETDAAYGVTATPDGEVFVTGSYSSEVDFDPGGGTDPHLSNGGSDIFVSKFNSSGDFEWARTWGGDGLSDRGECISFDKFSNIYICGAFQEIVDFNPGAGLDMHNSHGALDCFVNKFDSNGTFMWAHTWGGEQDDAAHTVGSPTMGVVVVAGEFNDAVDFDPGPGTFILDPPGNLCSFISLFRADSEFLNTVAWGRRPNQGGCEPVTSLCIDDFGNLYATGYFAGVIDFDPGPGSDNHSSNGGWDAFISKFNAAGEHLWTFTWGGSGDDRGLGIDVAGNGRIYVTGYFHEGVDFNPGPDQEIFQSNGMSDAFIVKYSPAGLW